MSLLSPAVLDNVAKHLKYEDIDNLAITCKSLNTLIHKHKGYTGECDDKHGYYPNSQADMHNAVGCIGDYRYWRGKLHGYQIIKNNYIVHTYRGVADKFIIKKSDESYLHTISSDFTGIPRIGIGFRNISTIVCIYNSIVYGISDEYILWDHKITYTNVRIYPGHIEIRIHDQLIKTINNERVKLLYDCFNKWDYVDSYLRGFIYIAPYKPPIHWTEIYYGDKKMSTIWEALEHFKID